MPQGAGSTDGAAGPRLSSTLQQGIRVLRALASADDPLLGVNEIARRIGTHKSTVSRLVATFEHEGLVEKEPLSGRYRLAAGVVALAWPLLANSDVRNAARPYLEELAATARETAGLAVWNQEEAVNLDQALGPGAVMHMATVGARLEPHSTASGKVFLAHTTDAERERILSRKLLRKTARTIVEPGLLLQDLAKVRERGYAVNDGEDTDEATGIAAPIYGLHGTLDAVVSVTAPRFRAPAERIAELGQMVTRAATEISKRLGSGNH
ncbi:IclR family transcriptional regulator [Streptomyces sp. NPDC047070]|uniref:IclR family transcriptional regulator n=1 Tax=Streptomyces sp. NPDC047070 TaxID=3154923 RepID=UPI003455EBF3